MSIKHWNIQEWDRAVEGEVRNLVEAEMYRWPHTPTARDAAHRRLLHIVNTPTTQGPMPDVFFDEWEWKRFRAPFEQVEREMASESRDRGAADACEEPSYLRGMPA